MMSRVSSILLFIACSCLWMGLFIAAETFPVCSRCDCSKLPNNLNGRVVDVPASLAETNWFDFNESIVSNQTVVLLFRSVDPSCNVEIKLKDINSTVQFIIYPGGRFDPTLATADLGPVRSFCSIWPDSVSLGSSVVSNGTELAIAFVKSYVLVPVVVDLQLLYRQHCPNVKNVGGIALPPPPVNGLTQKLKLINSYFGGGVPGASSTSITWSIAPPTPNCSMEVTFTNSTSNSAFALNELSLVLIGITHKVPRGQEAIIRVWKADSHRSVDAIVSFEYRAVDCGGSVVDAHGLNKLEIVSLNDVVKPLKRVAVPIGGDPWQTVNFTFPNDGAQQVAIWFLSGAEPAYVPFTSWDDRSGMDWRINQLYVDDFKTRFNSTLVSGTTPFGFLVTPYSASSSVSLKFAFLPVVAPPMLVAIANSSVPTELALTQNMITARKIYIKAANDSCAVEIRQRDAWTTINKARVLPFGFNSTLNDILDDFDDYYFEDKYVGSSLLRKPTRSVGPIMGIQFYDWIDLGKPPKVVLYRMVCPKQLNTAISRGTWKYVSPPAGTFLLPPPPSQNGQKCWVDVSTVSTISVLPRDGYIHLLVICLQPTMRFEILGGHQATSTGIVPCNGTLQADVYPYKGSWSDTPRDTSLFAYRVRCDGDSLGVDDGLAPVEPLEKKFVADDKWKALETKEYEYEDHNHAGYRNAWMLQAKNPNCRVEVFFDKTADLSSIKIFEDFMADVDGAAISHLDGSVRIKHLRYVSCDRRVFLSGLRGGVGKHNCKYRQVCGAGKPGFGCSQNTTMEPSLDGEWQTFQAVSNGNLNQLFQLHYQINLPAGSNITLGTRRLLELEFTSIVIAEAWSGTAIVDRGYHDSASEIHGVLINNKFRPIAGKQYLFKDSVKFKVQALARAKIGDHLFTVRYRWVDANQARQEIRLGEVLVATKKVKTLEFKVPKQFSRERLKEIIQNGHLEYEDHYGDRSIDFPLWFFRHLYTIRPSNASCRVALQFTKLDIGPGVIGGPGGNYQNEQHRLSVIAGSVGTQPVPLLCASDVMGDYSNLTLCARMDRTYISAPRSALGLLFKSMDVGEYEYEDLNSKVWGNVGIEITFGSGWSATYQEICDETKAAALAKVQPTLVKAKPMKTANDWQQGLSGLLTSDKDRLFRDKRWLLTPQQPDCDVQYVVKTKKASKQPSPLVFQVGTDAALSRLNSIFTSRNVTIIQLGTRKDHPFTFKYRQVCTQTPTARPTRSPTNAPTVSESAAGSRRDGDTCIVDRECASEICSKTLLRCTSKICSSQCASKAGSQSVCKSYAAIGCSCTWSASSASACIPVM